jgi:hypothetical protein
VGLAVQALDGGVLLSSEFFASAARS